MINKGKNFCYRISHIKNMWDILRDGICTKHHPNASKDFISIGNPEIIDVRDETMVRIDGYGNIGEYVPFYFTPKSMMLFNIITGFHKPIVKQYPKDEIIVVRCLIQDLSVTGKFFFTDGQANEKTMTKHYNDLKYLSNIDWDIIQQSDFKRTSIDTDKTRRYQAEFLMHEQVSVGNIESLHVYNEKAANFVKQEMAKTNALIPIHITKQYFFD